MKRSLQPSLCTLRLLAVVAWVVSALPCNASAVSVDVHFSVNMSLEAAWGRFDGDADLVVVRGDNDGLGDWTGSGVVLDRDAAGSRLFSGWCVLEVAPGDSVEYKFVFLEDGDPAQVRWEENVPNRRFYVPGRREGDAVARDAGREEPSASAGAADAEVDPGAFEIVTPATYFDHDAAWAPSDRLVGADVSFIPQLESLGAVYRVDGTAVEPLDALREAGFGLVRLRLWHTPAEPWNGLDGTVAFAKLAAAAGHSLMLDIHYSDTWADPGHQTKPAAWSALDFPALVDSVYAYTNAVVRRFRDEGVVPDYVQLGNEISGGVLWDDGRVGGAWDTPEQWDKLAGLLEAGAAAVADSLPAGQRPRIVIHVDNGGSNGLCRWFFDNLSSRGVEFDTIGLSFYPWWHGTLWDLRDNLRDLAREYGRDILVVETSYPWTLDGSDSTGNFVYSETQLHPGYPATPEGQTAFLSDLLSVVEGVPGGLGRGVVCWEPGFLSVPGGPGDPCENLTLFDFDGEALPALWFSVPWHTGVPADDESHGSLPLLSPGSPNPFESSTKLRLTVPSLGASVDVAVYDVSGRRVARLADGFMSGGVHFLDWSGAAEGGGEASAGVYFCRAVVGDRTDTAKLVRMR